MKAISSTKISKALYTYDLTRRGGKWASMQIALEEVWPWEELEELEAIRAELAEKKAEFIRMENAWRRENRLLRNNEVQYDTPAAMERASRIIIGKDCSSVTLEDQYKQVKVRRDAETQTIAHLTFDLDAARHRLQGYFLEMMRLEGKMIEEQDGD